MPYSLTHLRLKLAKELRKALIDITPPVLIKPFVKEVKRDRGKEAALLYANRISIDQDGPTPALFVRGAPVMEIPIARMRYTGGVSYLHPQHQMRKYYVDGIEALKGYYAAHQPKDIFEKHFLKSSGRADLPTEGIPWFEAVRGIDDITRGEKGLQIAGHGVQHHGPVSEQKLALERSRLDVVRASMSKSGFVPTYGFPTGYYLENKQGDWVFVVTRGQHRIAAMANLEYDSAPAQFQGNITRVVYEEHAAHWPMVRRGLLNEDEALEIFHSFFPENRKLVFANPK